MEAFMKWAALAWVRKFNNGELSPQNLQKAMTTIDPGKFRSLTPKVPTSVPVKMPEGKQQVQLPQMGKGLTGDYNQASMVAGNFPGQKPGLSVWKQPTYSQPQTGNSLAEAYRPMQMAIQRANARFNKQLPAGSQLIAPVHTVNNRGAFQTPAVGRGLPGKTVQEQTEALKKLDPEQTLMDAGPHNRNATGQLYDIMVPFTDELAHGWGMSRRNQGNQRINPEDVLPHLQHKRLAREIEQQFPRSALDDDGDGAFGMITAMNDKLRAKEKSLQADAVRRYWALQNKGPAAGDALFSSSSWAKKVQEATAAINSGMPITDPLTLRALELVRKNRGMAPDEPLVGRQAVPTGASIFD